MKEVGKDLISLEIRVHFFFTLLELLGGNGERFSRFRSGFRLNGRTCNSSFRLPIAGMTDSFHVVG